MKAYKRVGQSLYEVYTLNDNRLLSFHSFALACNGILIEQGDSEERVRENCNIDIETKFGEDKFLHIGNHEIHIMAGKVEGIT